MKLSVRALEFQRSLYGEIAKSNGREKPLSSPEFVRRMVQCAGDDRKISEKAVSAMATTLIQLLGIAQRLPYTALRCVDALRGTDLISAEAFVSIANLRAIPENRTSEEALTDETLYPC